MITSFKYSSPISSVALAALLLGALAFTGCRTVEGAGKDIERAGEKIQQNSK
jgi:predicted small secreted protein